MSNHRNRRRRFLRLRAAEWMFVSGHPVRRLLPGEVEEFFAAVARIREARTGAARRSSLDLLRRAIQHENPD